MPSFKNWTMRLVMGFLLFKLAAVNFLAQAPEQELSFSLNVLGRESIAPNELLEISTSRSLSAPDGRLAVFVGKADVTGLLVQTPNGVKYAPEVLPLPEGVWDVVVYLVNAGNQWKEAARWTVRVLAELGGNQEGEISGEGDRRPSTAVSQPVDEPSRLRVKPTLTVGFKSQAAESHFPEAGPVPRATFMDGVVQAGLHSSFNRGMFGMQNQFDLAGSSFRSEALRFGQLGDSAPRVDLSSYLMVFQVGRARLQMGHVNFGGQRHLINSFASRGLQITVPLRSWMDFSLAALNGNSIVGWNNFLGLNNRKHQVLAGTLGFEILPKRPGGVRFEASLLDGAVLPLSGFDQGVINDAERSRGNSARLVASDQAQRFRLDSGFTRSRFVNPSDPLLEQGESVVPVRESTERARYLDATWNALQNRKFGKSQTANLALTYRYEQVDPLFRSVAAFTQPDRLQNQVDLTATLGVLSLAASHLRSHNNLSNVESILKVLTRQSTFLASIPVSSLLSPTKPVRWLPASASWNWNQTHQLGLGTAPGPGFSDPSQIPDQMSVNQNATLEWQFDRYRASYRFNRSSQDNNQPGRQLADLRNLVNGAGFGGSVNDKLDLNYDVSVESTRNFEQNRIDHLWRSSVTFNWRPTPQMALMATLSGTTAGDLQQLSQIRNGEVDVQWSYRTGYEKSEMKRVQIQWSIRYANRYARTLDRLFGFGSLTKLQTVNVGMNITFF
ncbi:MAG: hypothetical protein AB1898_07300 [Acidobacteriota bacterium]